MLILVIGGSASGKSEYAESRMLAWDKRVYYATMIPFGKEGERTISRHRKLRQGKGFATVECGRRLWEKEQDFSGASVLLEDLPNLVANEMFAEDGATGDQLYDILKKDLTHLMQAGNLLVVSGDLFADGLAYDAETEKYRRLLADTNAWLASRADELVEVVCGIPIPYTKG